MKDQWIDNYAGRWHDDDRRTLVISTLDEEQASVDILLNGELMLRPWCNNAPASGLVARYSPMDGPSLNIDLGRPGFSLNVNYEFDEHPHEPESLSVGVSTYEDDVEADGYIILFGKLGRYKRETAEQNTERDS